MVRLAVAVFAGHRLEVRIEAFVSEAHAVVQRIAPRDDAAPGLGAALPIVHVVLLEGAAGAEHAYPREAYRLLHLGRSRLVGIGPGPDLGLVGAARMPY